MINFTTYIQQVANLIVISTGDPNFNTMYPGMIDYADPPSSPGHGKKISLCS